MALATMQVLRAAARSAAPVCGWAGGVRGLSVSARAMAAEYRRTQLYDDHVKLGASMASFETWTMPMLYREAHIESHVHTRAKASVFDVCHMQQVSISGADRHKFMDRICVADTAALGEGQMSYSLITNEEGGVIDDCMITSFDGFIYLVVNAGCAAKDVAHLNAQLKKFGGDVRIDLWNDRGLIALQGPKAHEVLAEGLSGYDLRDLEFLNAKHLKVHGLDCIVNRCGYTGEDGFEISVPEKSTSKLWNTLLKHDAVLPAGLAVRDSLRLEAGLCLYGHDINDKTTPMEASLLWTIGKRRRQEGGFLGSEKVLGQIADKSATQKRVGFEMKKGIAREGAFVIHPVTGQVIGNVTSGTFSPCLKKGVGMAYVDTEHTKNGTEVHVRVRDRIFEASICKMPFVPHQYYKK